MCEGCLETIIRQVFNGLWFDLSQLRKATLVQREKAGDSQGQGVSRGIVLLPRGGIGTVQLSLGLHTLLASCAWWLCGAGAVLLMHPNKSHTGLFYDPIVL